MLRINAATDLLGSAPLVLKVFRRPPFFDPVPPPIINVKSLMREILLSASIVSPPTTLSFHISFSNLKKATIGRVQSLFMAKAGSKVEEDKKIFRIRECVNPDPMPVSVSVYTGHTLQCILCTQSRAHSVLSVYPSVHWQCTSSIH